MTSSPAGIDLRPVTADEMPALFATIERTFGSDVEDDVAPYEIAALAPERTLGGFDGDRLVASAGIFTFDMTVPGGQVPCAGVTWIGVLPTHRRRGILTSVMHRQLTELHESGGESVAALWASEPTIYRRFGYGPGANRTWLRLESHAAFAAGVEFSPGRLHMVDAAEARPVAEAIYERVRSERPGLITRDEARWDIAFLDVPSARGGASSLTCVLLEEPDGPAGFLLYRTKRQWDDGHAAGTVNVQQLFATSAAGSAALWRYALSIDLMKHVETWNRPVDDPLLYQLADYRSARPKLGDSLWVRLVDVDRALAARTYTVPGSVVIEVVDHVCPWNAGRLLLEADGDGVSCTRTSATPAVTLSATELGAAYLGGTRISQIAAAGFVDEHEAGAVARLDLMFAHPLQPWCAEVF